MLRTLNVLPDYGPTWPKHAAGILNSHLFYITRCVLSWHLFQIYLFALYKQAMTQPNGGIQLCSNGHIGYNHHPFIWI